MDYVHRLNHQAACKGWGRMFYNAGKWYVQVVSAFSLAPLLLHNVRLSIIRMETYLTGGKAMAGKGIITAIFALLLRQPHLGRLAE